MSCTAASRERRGRLSEAHLADNLTHVDFYDHVLAEIGRFGVAPGDLILEVTESRLMNDPRASLDVLTRLRLKRISLSMDDFGTGHSSLSRLNQMLVTTLKIDRSFIADLPGDTSSAVLVATIIQLAQNLGLHPLAEGIETEEQRRFLVDNGCMLGQGFLFSRPVPADRIVQLYQGFEDAA